MLTLKVFSRLLLWNWDRWDIESREASLGNKLHIRFVFVLHKFVEGFTSFDCLETYWVVLSFKLIIRILILISSYCFCYMASLIMPLLSHFEYDVSSITLGFKFSGLLSAALSSKIDGNIRQYLCSKNAESSYSIESTWSHIKSVFYLFSIF